MSISYTFNPMGTDGFEFVEFTSPHSGDLESLFLKMGFRQVAKHPDKEVCLYRQERINFLINRADDYAKQHAAVHGPSACAMAFRVQDAHAAFNRAQELGALKGAEERGEKEAFLPAIKGIGNSLLYLMDEPLCQSFYGKVLKYLPQENPYPQGMGLMEIDHLTHNVYPGQLQTWTDFYKKFFHFKEQKSFEIFGQHTGMISRAMISPCGKIRIPINESTDNKSQIAEYLEEYKGEGIQHIAFSTSHITQSVEQLKKRQIPFMTVPSSYYTLMEQRFSPDLLEIQRLADHHILIDGERKNNQWEILFQIFTHPLIGPIFFEIIERKGHQGFGEGNITALFEVMERDQQQRGVL